MSSAALPVARGVQEAPSKGFWAASSGRAAILGALLVIVTVAVYSPVRTHPFVNFDDSGYVTTNQHIQGGLDWDTVRWSLTTFREANWHPVTWLSHALDCQLFGLDPAGPHMVNVLLHALNALLLFWVLLRATGYMGRSFMVAALFALHPVNVESVAWIAERKTVLSMLFFLLALGAYGWYARKPRVGPYAVVALLFALGSMCKPQVITLPFVLLLWDYWPLQRMSAHRVLKQPNSPILPEVPARSLSWLIAEKFPLFLMALASAAITMHAQRAGGATNWYPRSVRLENAIVCYARYLLNAIWPSHLALMYPHANSLSRWYVVGALSLLLVITAFAAEYPWRRYLTVGWLWFLGTMVPMIGLVQVGGQAMADRYAYLPFIGLFIMLCWATADWAVRQKISMRWVVGVSVAVLVALTALTHRQIDYWSDNLTLWSHTLQVTSDNFIAENSMGVALEREGRNEEAITHFRAALAIFSLDAASNINVADYDRAHGDLQAAIHRYKRVTEFARNARQRAEAFTKMSEAYDAMGDSAHAREARQAAQELQRGQ